MDLGPCARRPERRRCSAIQRRRPARGERFARASRGDARRQQSSGEDQSRSRAASAPTVTVSTVVDANDVVASAAAKAAELAAEEAE